jgi:heme/copper-type cytochrome/quinol oxidase subunit 4
MAPNGRRRPAHSKGDANMRKFILSSVLTLVAFGLTVVAASASSIGPGV